MIDTLDDDPRQAMRRGTRSTAAGRGRHRYGAVADLVEPLLVADAHAPYASKIATAAYLPDAAEAFVNLGRLDEAEVLIDRLEGNGRRLDRAWMLAVGGRCRALLNAAHGDLEVATSAAERAVAEHERIPMPFEKARTQLVLGQLQRRQCRREAAAATLGAAVATFEKLGMPLWAARARRTRPLQHRSAPTHSPHPSELAVAELVCTGLTNRDVAVKLFISQKTVEANVGRIYRKLNIHSRAQLIRHMCQPQAKPVGA